MSQFNSTSYQVLRIAAGTDKQPLQVNYYREGRLTITIISSDATTPQITTSTAHGLNNGDSVFISDSDSDAVVDGSHTVTYVSSTEFTISGVDTTTSAGTAGFVYSEKTLAHQINIDSYDVSGYPIWNGQVLYKQHLNIGEARFESLEKLSTNNPNMLPILDPTRFTTVNQTGNTRILNGLYQDVNNTGNANFTVLGTAATLYVVSDSADDGGAGPGLSSIFIEGLDDNLNEVAEVVVTNGITPVATAFTYRTINGSFPTSGGTPGGGAAGNITISTENSATPSAGSIFLKYLVGNQGSRPGRYTTPTGKRLLVTNLIINGGAGCDMTVLVEVTFPGLFPFTIFEGFVSGEFWSFSGSTFFLTEGATLKWRGFTNSGNPSQRKLQCTFIGVLATNEAWDAI